MSQVLTGEQSLEPPSRYTVFEREVFGASSPQSQTKPTTSTNKRKIAKRFSEVAFAGESPNLNDVSSGVLAKTKKTLSLSSSKKQTNQTSCLVLSPASFGSGSSTPSLDVIEIQQNVCEPQQRQNSPKEPCTGQQKGTQDLAMDLLTTESLIESSAVINGQPNILRVESSPDVGPVVVGRLSRSQQIELSVRKAREWLNNIPEDSDPIPGIPPDTSLISTISRNSVSPADATQQSVLLVAPDPHVREVRILLQRLDPQLLLRVPIRDIQNMMQTPSNLSLPQVQRTMHNLLTSNKIGITTVDKRSLKSIQSKTVSKDTDDEQPSTSAPTKKMSKPKKRRLFTVQRQPSNVSQDINVSNENLNVGCPYVPPPTKKRLPKKTNLPIEKELKPKRPSSKNRRKSKAKEPETKKLPGGNQKEIVTRSRSSESLKVQPIPQPTSSKSNLTVAPSRNRSRNKSHEMTLRRKSNSRRTSFLFQPKSQTTKRKRPSKRFSISMKKDGPRVVCTFLHRGEVESVAKIIKKLGGMMENKVSAVTTHVVCGEPKRTVNVLRGIARGCWLVKKEWVFRSLEKRCWIDEEPYEITNFSPAVQKCRIAKQTLGIYPTIFEKVGTVFVAPKTAPPKSELCELLKLCGGKIVTTTRRAAIVVGTRISGVTCVSEIWVLDSIQQNMLLPFQSYCLERDE